MLGIAALLAHVAFCEWRVVEYDAARAPALEGRVLWAVRRVSHPGGNAAAFDARKAELRAYHGDWLDCWERERVQGGADPCHAERVARTDATTRAVRLAACERRSGLDVSRQPAFRRCLASRGHPDAPPPRWTRDDFGIRFAGPYWTLTALFAEDLGGAPATSRAVGGLLGVALPALLCLAALACLRGGAGGRGVDDRDPAG